MDYLEIKVRFVEKENIFPYFGRFNYNTGEIEIQKGLSRFEICSLLVHEFGHSDDLKDKEGFYHKELESITMSMFYPVIGTIIIAIKTLFSWSRLKAYYKRIKTQK